MKCSAGRISLAACCAFALGACYESAQLVRLQREHAAIAVATSLALEDERPRVAFAAAQRAAQDGDTLRALAAYRRVAHAGDAALRQAARYNGANLHLREAIAMRSMDGAIAVAQSRTLLELAKQGYRDVLRADPQHWDAKYNLERALRLAPEDDDGSEALLPPPRTRERAVTTMQGFTLGLP